MTSTGIILLVLENIFSKQIHYRFKVSIHYEKKKSVQLEQTMQHLYKQTICLFTKISAVTTVILLLIIYLLKRYR